MISFLSSILLNISIISFSKILFFLFFTPFLIFYFRSYVFSLIGLLLLTTNYFLFFLQLFLSLYFLSYSGFKKKRNEANENKFSFQMERGSFFLFCFNNFYIFFKYFEQFIICWLMYLVVVQLGRI